MPTVPVSRGTSVRSNPLPSARVNTSAPLSAFGGGDALTQSNNAAQNLNNDISGKALDIHIQQKSYADDVRTRAADLELSKAETDVQVMVDSLKGENSFGAPDVMDKEWKSRAEKIREGLSNDNQKAQFDKVYMARTASLYDFTQKHVAREAKSYDKQLTDSYVVQAQAQAAMNYMDIGPKGKVEQSIYAQEQQILKYSMNNGVPVPVAQQAITKARSSTYTAVIGKMLANQDTGAANAYLTEKKADISEDDQDKIKKMFKASSDYTKDTLTEKLFDGILTLEEIEASATPEEEGGTGAGWAKKMMKDLGKVQADKIETFRENSDLAEKYVDLVDKVFTDKDSFKMKEILVDAFADGTSDRQETQKLNRLIKLMDKKRASGEDNKLSNGFGMLRGWFDANENDKKELANAVSNYTTFMDSDSGQGGGGGNPEEVAEGILRDQYNKLNPQAPLGKDDKVFDPKREREISFVPVERALKGIGRGIGGTFEGFGAGLEWLGAKEVGEVFQQWGKDSINFYKVEDPTYLDQVYEGLGSMTTFFIPGLGITKGVGLLKVAPKIAAWIGVGTSSVLESVVESGSTYKQAIENGYGDKSASLSATSAFWANLPAIAVTNKLGVFGDKGPKILQVLTSGVMEGAQEFTQALIGNIALSDPINWKEATVSASIGAITGSGVKAAVSVTETLDDLGVAKEFLDDLKAKTVNLKSERGSVVNPLGDGQEGQEPIEINPKDANDPLNFKTAEEYVASKGNIFYRSSEKPYNATLMGEDGIFVSPDKKFVEGWANSQKYKHLEEIVISKDAKIMRREDIPSRFITDGPAGSMTTTDDEEALFKYAKTKGYDGVENYTLMPEGTKFQPEIAIWNSKKIHTKSQLTAEWEAAQKAQQAKSDSDWDQDLTPPKPAEGGSEFEGMNDKQLVGELADLVSNFDAGQVTVDMEGNYSRVSSSFLPDFSEKGYTKKYLNNIYEKYIAGEKLTEKQAGDLVYTLNSFKEMFGIKTSESIPDIVTAQDIKNNKANQAIVKQIGKMLAKPVPTSKVKSIVRESTGQVKEQGGQVSERTAFLQSLKDRVKAAKQAEKFTREQIFDTQNDLINLIDQSELEANDKAKFLKMIKNIQTPKDLAKVMQGTEKTAGLEERIDTLISKEERRSIVSDIKNAVTAAKNSNSIAVDYVKAIEAMVEEVDLKNRKPETIARIQAMKDFLDAKIKNGQDVEVTREMLKDLKILEKKKFDDMSNEDLTALLRNIEKAIQLGQTKLQALENIRATKKQNALQELVKGSVPVESKDIKQGKIGQKLSAGDKFKNSVNQSLNKIQEVDLAISPMDVVFDILDGNKNYKGPNYKIFKQTVDKLYSKYLAKVDSMLESVHNLSNELKLTEESLEKIGFYAAKIQKGGADKLMGMGYTEQEIEAVQLNEKEMKLYTIMREKLDALRPEIQEVMRLAYNQDLDVVDDYFPFMTDFDAMSDSELRERFGNNVELVGMAKKKNVKKGFTEKRVGGKQRIRLNAIEVFNNHVDNAVYLVELGPTIKDLGDIAQSQEYGEAVGELGQEVVREWIDLLARKGGTAGKRIRILDKLRKNVGVATLGFKLSSFLIQPTALLDGASMIGGKAFEGAFNVATSREWRQFLKANFPELRARGADDPAYLEFGGNDLRDKAGRAGFWALRNMDMLTASSVVAGAYSKAVEDKGGKVDFSKPDQDAIVEAQRILRRTQASAFPKDLPSAVSQGGLTGNVSLDKLVLQFQSFMINRWSLVRHDMMAAGIKEKNVGKLMNMFFFLAMANFAEVGVRRFSKELLAAMTGEDLKDWDETFNKEIVMSTLGNIPFVSHAISAINYGSVPVPAIDMGARIIEKFNRAATAKRESTKDKNFKLGLMLGLGVVFRIPGTVQGEQIMRHLMNADKDRKKTKNSFE